MKLLVLIISSHDYLPHYPILKQLWQSYFPKYSSFIDFYFLDSNNELNQDFVILPNHFVTKQTETLKPGILNKTILAIKHLSPLQNYDYIIRTNLSSLWNFNALRNYLQKTYIDPFNFFYASQMYGNDFTAEHPFGHGACIIFNTFTSNFLINNSKLLDYTIPDDIAIGKLFYEQKIQIHSLPNISINSPNDFLKILLRNDLHNIFHFRIKCSLDIIIQQQLLNETLIFIKNNLKIDNYPQEINESFTKINSGQPITMTETNKFLRYSLEPTFYQTLINILKI